jgi:hypothetical protein
MGKLFQTFYSTKVNRLVLGSVSLGETNNDEQIKHRINLNY